jgi:hypothetical protein
LLLHADHLLKLSSFERYSYTTAGAALMVICRSIRRLVGNNSMSIRATAMATMMRMPNVFKILIEPDFAVVKVTIESEVAY